MKNETISAVCMLSIVSIGAVAVDTVHPDIIRAFDTVCDLSKGGVNGTSCES